MEKLPLTSMGVVSGPKREQDGICTTEKARASWSVMENNKKCLHGIWSKAREKLLSSLRWCPFLNLAQSADLHECDVFMAPVISGSDSGLTKPDGILYKSRLKGVWGFSRKS